jgi:hypothetical protein
MSILMSRPREFRKFVPLTKVEELPDGSVNVYGVVTAEVLDKDREICDYVSTKPHYQKWSDDLSKASNGRNLGNLREMHGLSAIGAGKQLDFDDAAKVIKMGFKVVDDRAVKKVREAVYTGFSQGGAYQKTWKDKEGVTHYTARPTEISLVDNPCLISATFEFVRADGTSEMRKFVLPPAEPDIRSDKLLTVDEIHELAKAKRMKQEQEQKEKEEADAAKEPEVAPAEEQPEPEEPEEEEEPEAAEAEESEEEKETDEEEDVDSDVLKAAMIAYLDEIEKGDTPGHPFRGNQYTTDRVSALLDVHPEHHQAVVSITRSSGEQKRLQGPVRDISSRLREIGAKDRGTRAQIDSVRGGSPPPRPIGEQGGLWAPASRGQETPFKTRTGRRLQYMFNRETRQHAYYDVDQDRILDDREAEEARGLAASSMPADLLKSIDEYIGQWIPEEVTHSTTAPCRDEDGMVKNAAVEADNALKGVIVMADEKADLQKAASAKGHLGMMREASKAFHEKCAKVSDGLAEHHTKLSKLHQARTAEVTDHFTKLHKILGTEEIENLADEKPEAINPEAGGTKDVSGVTAKVEKVEVEKVGVEKAAPVIDQAALIAELKKTMTAEFDQLLKGVLIGIIGEEKAKLALAEADEPVTKATPGIGDRSALSVGAGPVLRVMPVRKTDDAPTTGLDKPEVKEEPADIQKALSGDSAEALKLMKSSKASQVPTTLVGLVGGMGR